MKKLKLLVTMCLMFVFIISTAYALELEYDGKKEVYEGPEITLMINGQPISFNEEQLPPILIEDRTLVPVREVFENLGGEVTWDNENKKVTVVIGFRTIELTINDTTALVNKEEVVLDVPAKIINNKTMVPVRFIAEKSGFIVNWFDNLKTVSIYENIPENSESVKQDGENIVVDPRFSIIAQNLNSKYTKYFGEKKGKTAAYQLCNLIYSNNVGNQERAITIEYNDNGVVQTSASMLDVYNINSTILKTTRCSFNISGDYDEEGFVNKVIIEKVNW